jgi:hypothetical protein
MSKEIKEQTGELMQIRVTPPIAKRIRRLRRKQKHWKSNNHVANYALEVGMKAAEELIAA